MKEHCERKVFEALRNLSNEVSAILGIADEALREAVGHTNTNVLSLRLAEAREALAAFTPRSEDEIRAEFEAWVVTYNPDASVTRCEGVYDSRSVDVAWVVWLAATRSAERRQG